MTPESQKSQTGEAAEKAANYDEGGGDFHACTFGLKKEKEADLATEESLLDEPKEKAPAPYRARDPKITAKMEELSA